MSGQSHYVLSQELDDIDIIMSQMKSESFEQAKTGDSKKTSAKHGMDESDVEMDEMDMVISQIDTEKLHLLDIQPNGEAFDEMDTIISQIDTEQLQENLQDMPQELLNEFGDAVAEIDDEMVEQVQNEEYMDEEVPVELLEEYKNAMDGIMPTKSGNRYLQAYEVFRKWQLSYRTNSFDEKIVMAYFGAASKKFKPPTLWSMYSMLKKTLLCKHNVDLTKHCRLKAFLKMKADGYQGKKANVFEAEDLQKFFVEAPNNVYLGMKVNNGKVLP